MTIGISGISGAQQIALSAVESATGQQQSDVTGVVTGESADPSFMGIGQNIDIQA